MAPFGNKKHPFFISSIEEFDEFRIIRLKGSLDRDTIPQAIKFMRRMQNRANFQHKNTLIDFKDVVHIDTTAVAALIMAISEFKKAHHKLGIINLKEYFRNEIKLLKVDPVVAEYPTEKMAIKDFRS